MCWRPSARVSFVAILLIPLAGLWIIPTSVAQIRRSNFNTAPPRTVDQASQKGKLAAKDVEAEEPPMPTLPAVIDGKAVGFRTVPPSGAQAAAELREFDREWGITAKPAAYQHVLLMLRTHHMSILPTVEAALEDGRITETEYRALQAMDQSLEMAKSKADILAMIKWLKAGE